MSKYFNTLKRLEREQAERRAVPQQPAPSIEIVEGPALATAVQPSSGKVVRIGTPHGQPRNGSGAGGSGRTVGSFSSLLDNLRALGGGTPVSSIVISGVSSVESTEAVSTGLAGEICRHSLSVMIAELYHNISHPLLRVRMASGPDRPDTVKNGNGPGHRKQILDELSSKELQLDLRGGPVPAPLSSWLESARSVHDVVIIEAPPLGISVDAAIVARACDGLILVVEPNATPRDALSVAVERAETVGCRVLGVVMQGRPEWRPRWLRRLTATQQMF